MPRVIWQLIALVGLIGSAVVPTGAHHAFASEFDVDRPVRIEGAIARVELTNPHGWIHLDVTTADGKTERWSFETIAARNLARKGFTKDSVKFGTKIVIEGFLAKGIPRRATAQTVTYPDGRMVIVGSAPDGTPLEP